MTRKRHTPHPNTFLRHARALGYQFGAADARDGREYSENAYGTGAIGDAFAWGYSNGFDAFDSGEHPF